MKRKKSTEGVSRMKNYKTQHAVGRRRASSSVFSYEEGLMRASFSYKSDSYLTVEYADSDDCDESLDCDRDFLENGILAAKTMQQSHAKLCTKNHHTSSNSKSSSATRPKRKAGLTATALLNIMCESDSKRKKKLAGCSEATEVKVCTANSPTAETTTTPAVPPLPPPTSEDLGTQKCQNLCSERNHVKPAQSKQAQARCKPWFSKDRSDSKLPVSVCRMASGKCSCSRTGLIATHRTSKERVKREKASIGVSVCGEYDVDVLNDIEPRLTSISLHNETVRWVTGLSDGSDIPSKDLAWKSVQVTSSSTSNTIEPLIKEEHVTGFTTYDTGAGSLGQMHNSTLDKPCGFQEPSRVLVSAPHPSLSTYVYPNAAGTYPYNDLHTGFIPPQLFHPMLYPHPCYHHHVPPMAAASGQHLVQPIPIRVNSIIQPTVTILTDNTHVHLPPVSEAFSARKPGNPQPAHRQNDFKRTKSSRVVSDSSMHGHCSENAWSKMSSTAPPPNGSKGFDCHFFLPSSGSAMEVSPISHSASSNQMPASVQTHFKDAGAKCPSSLPSPEVAQLKSATLDKSTTLRTFSRQHRASRHCANLSTSDAHVTTHKNADFPRSTSNSPAVVTPLKSSLSEPLVPSKVVKPPLRDPLLGHHDYAAEPPEGHTFPRPKEKKKPAKLKTSEQKTTAQPISGSSSSGCIRVGGLELSGEQILRSPTIPNTGGWMRYGDSFMKKVHTGRNILRQLRRCYDAIQHMNGDVIRCRDSILVRSGTEKPFVAKITAIWEAALTGDLTMTLLWYYRPEQLEMEPSQIPQYLNCEIFASKHRDDNSVACIEDKCFVLSAAKYNRYVSAQRAAEQSPPLIPLHRRIVPELPSGMCSNICSLPPLDAPADTVFLCRRVYDLRLKKILKNPLA